MSTNLEQILITACREYADAHAEWTEGKTEDSARQEAAHRAIITLGEAVKTLDPLLAVGQPQAFTTEEPITMSLIPAYNITVTVGEREAVAIGNNDSAILFAINSLLVNRFQR